MQRVPFVLLILLVVVPRGVAAFDADFAFEPMLPRPSDAITLSVTYDTACFLRGEAELEGRTVRVFAVEGCACPAVLPSPFTFDVTLGRLSPTVYDVELWLARRDPSMSCGDDQLLDGTRLVVQTVSTHVAIAPEPLEPSDGERVILRVDSFCPSAFRDVRVVGDLVFIEETPSAIAAPCGPLWQSELDLGELSAGRYSLLFLFDESFPLPGPGPAPGPGDGPLLLNTVDTLIVGERADPPPSGAELLLGEGRFRVTALFGGEAGLARAVELTPRSGYFWFFSSDNVELVVKILDGCAFNGHHWFFAAGLTDIEVEILVEDRFTDTRRSYHTPGGGFEEIRDALAFSGCPESDP